MVMESTALGFKRGRSKRSDIPVPLAFSFDADPVQPVHAVTVVGWSDTAREALRDLREHIASRRPGSSLPVESLRGRLEVADPDNLRLDRGLGLRGRDASILWTPLAPDEAVRRVGGAVLGWLTDVVLVSGAADREIVQSLRRLARRNELVSAVRRKVSVFAWERTRTGTAGPAANQHAYEDLADFTARRLEGQELLPGCGGLRRIAGRRLDLNEAELMTEPLLDRSPAFSIVVRVVVYSYVGRATPIVVLRFSRRTWVRSLPGAAAATLTAFALPEDTPTALTFTLRRRRVSREGRTVYSYEPDDDFAPIARACGLLLSTSGDEIAGSGYLDAGCRLLVPHKHGVGPPEDARPGVPDLDKMTAFRRAAEVLAPTGLRPWDGLEVASATRAQQDRDQRWRDRDGNEAHREAFERWRETTKADIVACYSGVHSVVVAHHPSCHPDAVKVGALLREMLGDHVQVQSVRIPDDVHGGRSALPAPAVDKPGNRDYADLRAQAWKPFISEVGRYRQESGTPLDGILVLAPEWYGSGTTHDDRVNKRAGRITLATELRVPVQYLRPEREAADFETRLMMAWRDLAWRNVGRIRAERLAEAAERVYGGTGLLPPDRVLGVGVLRRNKTRLANETSFVPYALELDLQAGTCSARFARERGPALEILPSMPLAEALVELAASGPIKLAVSKAGRLEQLQERTQRFLHEAITEFCQRAGRPLVLIDGPACRQVWPWAADTRLDPANVLIAGHPHAEADWRDARIVRVRTGNAPKVLFDGRFEGPWGPDGDIAGYDAPKWAEARLLKLTDSDADVYLSFGSLLRKGRILGTSCYRDVEGLEKLPGKPPRYVPGRLRQRPDPWNTPSGVEYTVVRVAHGESPDQLARLVEQLRTVYVHMGDWSMKPAPLHFEGALKQYLADYQLDDDDAEDDGS